jgi:hypothetical protein
MVMATLLSGKDPRSMHVFRERACEQRGAETTSCYGPHDTRPSSAVPRSIAGTR